MNAEKLAEIVNEAECQIGMRTNLEVGDGSLRSKPVRAILTEAIGKAIESLGPEEIHNLCHNLAVPAEEFAQACMDYQEKLFGHCPTRAEILMLKSIVKSHSLERQELRRILKVRGMDFDGESLLDAAKRVMKEKESREEGP